MNRELTRGKAEKALYAAALVLAELYLLVSVFRHFVPAYDRLIDFLQWYSLILALSALLYWFFVKHRELHTKEEKKMLLSRFGSYEQVYMVCLFFWYIITVAMRQYMEERNLFLANDLWMYVTGMCAFLFFPFARYTGREKAKRAIEIMLHTAVLSYTVLAAWIIWNYFRMNYITFPSGQQLMREAPAILCFTGLNHTRLGEQALIMIGCSLYMTVTQKPGVKIVYGLCLFVNMILLILSNARTSWYMTSGMLVSAAFLFCWNRMENRKLILRVVSGILLAAATILFCHWLRGEVFDLLETATVRATEAAELTTPGKTKTASDRTWQLQTLSRQEDGKNLSEDHSKAALSALSADETGNNEEYIRTIYNNRDQMKERLKIYKTCFFLMFTSRYRFLFGITPADFGRTILGVNHIDIAYGHAHNFFLQMGVSYGVPTMIATVVFAISLLVRSIRILFINRKKLFPGAAIICLTVLFILGSDMFSGRLNASPDFICTGFYLFAGWLVALDMDTRAPKKNGKHAWF